MKIKVLNIITGGLLSDGITTSWLTFCKELKSNNNHNNVQMDFANIQYLSDPNIEAQFTNIGIKTIYLPSRLNNPLKYIWELYKVLKYGKYNIVHANGSNNSLALEMFAAWLAKVPIRIAHSRNTFSNSRFVHYVFTFPFKWFCNCRIACGLDAGRWLFGNNKFKILHNGKRLDSFKFSEDKRREAKKSLNLKNEFVLGHVGHFNEQKNHVFILNVFLEILKLQPNSKLLLIGEGPKLDEIKSLVNKYAIKSKVIFTGAISDVPFKLHSADIMVLPSLFEGLPNVVLEWQALGLPCVISSTITQECAVSDLVHFVDLREKEDIWATKIINILSEKHNRLNDSLKGCLALKQQGFDISDNVDQLIKIYKKELENNKYKKFN